jgi:hypothetical protein
MVAYEVPDGAFDAESFLEFVRRLTFCYQAHPVPNVYLMMANCRTHHSDELREAIETAGFLLEFLPPYGSMQNPMEEVIADIKREIRRILSTALLARVLKIQALHWGEETIAPRALRRMVLAEAMRAITILQVNAHSYAFLPRALNREQL